MTTGTFFIIFVLSGYFAFFISGFIIERKAKLLIKKYLKRKLSFVIPSQSKNMLVKACFHFFQASFKALFSFVSCPLYGFFSLIKSPAQPPIETFIGVEICRQLLQYEKITKEEFHLVKTKLENQAN